MSQYETYRLGYRDGYRVARYKYILVSAVGWLLWSLVALGVLWLM